MDLTDEALDALARRVLLDAARRSCAGEAPAHDFSPAFSRRMKKLLRRAGHPVRWRLVRAAACLLLAAALGGGSLVAFVPAARAAFTGWVRELYETWFVYRRAGAARPIPENTVYCADWVPAGYRQRTAPVPGSFVRALYEDADGRILNLSYLTGAQSASLNVEWEGAEVCPVQVGGLAADLYRNPEDGPSILVWTDEERDAVFWLAGALPEADLLRMAESVRLSDPLPRAYRITWLPLCYGGYCVAGETGGEGWKETVYESSEVSVAFGYGPPARAPQGEGTARTVTVHGQPAPLYASGGEYLLRWTPAGEEDAVLWLRGNILPEELVQLAESVEVDLSRYSDMAEIQTAEVVEGPTLPAVARALDGTFTARVEAFARRDAAAGVYMPRDYVDMVRNTCKHRVSPRRITAIRRVSALLDAIEPEEGLRQRVVSLFGPFYTASIDTSGRFTTVHICDERGVMIAAYQSGTDMWTEVATAEEMQFNYLTTQIYAAAHRKAKAAEGG